MSRISKGTWLSYGIGLIAALAMVGYYVSGQDIGSLSPVEQYRVLSDGFAIPGMLGLLVGLLLSLSGQGALDGIGYCLARAVHALSFQGTKAESYQDYLERHQSKRMKGFGFLYGVGLTCLAMAGIFLALFHNMR